ncbi:MAG: SDR family oxidoreductase, partial [Bacteroidales bacterium]|nr:SDR family oxidoreductase [Bacteroidales bacterium]
MNLELQNKNVLITGATGGIGTAICKHFLEEGANVIALYRNERKLNIWLALMKVDSSKTDHIFTYLTNLDDEDQTAKAMKKVLEEHLTIHIFVHCAGITREAPFALHSSEDIEKIMQTNFTSVVNLTQLVLKPMFKQKSGAIIYISSVLAH